VSETGNGPIEERTIIDVINNGFPESSKYAYDYDYYYYWALDGNFAAVSLVGLTLFFKVFRRVHTG